MSWTNQVGITYRVFFTPDIATPLLLWPPLEDAFSDDFIVSVGVSTADSSTGFFRVQIPTNGASPAVQIFSPADAQIVSGEIDVRMGAQLGAQVQGVNLYLDDALVGYLDSGGMDFKLDTTHFANGQHTIYVGAVDTANNETLSSSITLDFENPVRWLDACSMFNSLVPIDVESDIYPADWMVTVMGTNGTIVRTMIGSTDDGIIQTNWDGTDDNGQYLPVENLYQIQVMVVEQGSSITSASSATASGTTVENDVSAESDPMTSSLELLENYENAPDEIKMLYPPLPPPPVSTTRSTVSAPKEMSAAETFLAEHSLSGTSPLDAESSLRSGSTKTLVWWENPWNSGQTIVARVPISGAFGTTVANNCNQIAALIENAADTVGNNRDVYLTTVQVISSAGDLANLTNAFVNRNITALYFYVHGNTNGNAIGTTSAGVWAKDVGTILGNYFIPALPPSYGYLAGKPGLVTHHPYSLVFLDGCNTALGDFPEAFGIPKHVSGASLNEAGLHKRLFMGWSAPVVFQFDSSHLDWTLQFWTAWMNDPSYDETASDAIRVAYQHDPSVLNNVPIQWCGNGSLKWSDR
ncbi:MAG TPA: Ig-like domain-containing protein [Verrucomicrobiae bacterium]|nr:Ig-like domain-containing protein [Verrucomicrobiae bacterium]